MPGLQRVGRGWPPLVLAACLVLLDGCTSGPSEPGRSGPTQVPLPQVDLSGVSAVRAPFCSALDEDALSTVLGGRPWRDASYAPGDRVALTPALRDVAHEYGCTFRKHGVVARAWLFAQPVSRSQARQYVADRRSAAGCSAAGTLGFGSPGVVQRCRPAAGSGSAGAAPGTELVTMSGLFGSGYLTCQVSTRRADSTDDLLPRTERWCASVATTVGSP